MRIACTLNPPSFSVRVHRETSRAARGVQNQRLVVSRALASIEEGGRRRTTGEQVWTGKRRRLKISEVVSKNKPLVAARIASAS